MAPRKGALKSKSSKPTPAPTRRSARRGKGASGGDGSGTGGRAAADVSDGIPQVYREMLLEAEAEAESQVSMPRATQSDGQGRATKKQKVVAPAPTKLAVTPPPPLDEVEIERDESVPVLPGDDEIEMEEVLEPAKFQQTVYDEFQDSAEEDDEDDDDVDFEDVELEPGLEALDHRDRDQDQDQDQDQDTLRLDLSRPINDSSNHRTPTKRRKPATSVERKLRLDVHKWHVLCFLLHQQCRNRWCDDPDVQASLKPLIPRKTISLLHMDESKPQFQRTHAFNKGVEEICAIWRREWKIIGRGLRRAYWVEDADVMRDLDNAEDPVDIDDFREAARTKSGTRDLGAQLFCALLRSLALETRLVFSFQPLPFSGVAKGVTPEKPKPEYILASSLGRKPDTDMDRGADKSSFLANPRSRLYDKPPSKPSRSTTLASKNRIKESPHPVFWVEVFNEAIQTWIPLDPLVRHTINKPKTGFEPPANDSLNSMSYVIAFEDDGSAKDVTRRYAQHYNAKTRKCRVECTKGGEGWWAKTMRFFEKPFPEDRNDIEDGELAAREASEAMPRNVQDFKDHPHYALERHLRRNEVIHPKRAAGRVSAGVSKDAKLESVYRRRDVHLVRSADQWYRRGRDVKMGEQPLKRIVLQRRDTPPEEDEADGTRLYAEFQTQPYIAPTVVDGKVPKNAYGNLDVYLPSMIPAGAFHLQHPEAARAAKILGIDYADAVTGFDFRGRHGTAVVNGVVAASEYREALVEVLRGLIYERTQREDEKRTLMALQMWKRFMTGLRIKEQVARDYASDGDRSENGEAEHHADVPMQDDHDVDDSGGGFFPGEGGATTVPMSPVERPLSPLDSSIWDRPHGDGVGGIDQINFVIVESPHKLKVKLPEPSAGGSASPGGGGRFMAEGDDDGVVRDEPNGASTGGGFMVEEEEDEEEAGNDGGGGGFFPAADDDDNAAITGNDETVAAAAAAAAGGGGFMIEGGDTNNGEDEWGSTTPNSTTTVKTPNKPPSNPNTLEPPSSPDQHQSSLNSPSTSNPNPNPPPPTSSPQSAAAAATKSNPPPLIHLPPSSPPPTQPPLSPQSRTQETIISRNDNLAPPHPPRGSQSNDDEGDEDDNCSLISHDPDDDEAVPEWLV